MRVRKAVIPVAGFGTRLLPASKTVPKTMLQVVDRPVIHYVVEAAVQSGIEQIIFVTSSNNKALEDYFDASYELEAALERSGKTELLAEIRGISSMAETVYVRQKQQLGNGHAVLMARDVVGAEPFAMLWGDDVLIGDPPVPRQLIEIAERFEAPVVGVRRVADQDVEKYGIVEVESLAAEPEGSRLSRALSMVEKPRRGEAPSDFAQIGGVVLTPEIFGLLEKTPKDATGEIYLANALVELMRSTVVYAYEFEGRRYDCGDKMDLLKANVEIALQRPGLGGAFRKYLQDVVGVEATQAH
jgi:UTP--glucose-1-phosphate uridylyltransferase